MTDCPCGSKHSLDLCCGPYLSGSPAPTAEKLMRSRYSAYALGRFDYIARTCAGPAALAFDRTEAERGQIGTQWLGLDIRSTRQGGANDSEGTVKFVFRYRQNGQEVSQQETSIFRRIGGLWFYYDRKSAPPAASAVAQIGRNDPCPCGSGKKYKKCCG